MASDDPATAALAHAANADSTDPAAGDESALVAAALRDRHEFATIYERYADRLYSYTLARTGDATLADDVVGDVMVDALAGLERFDPARGSLAAWLFTIAGRRIVDRQRAHGRFRRAIHRFRTSDESHDDAAETVIRNEEAQRVRAALALLPETDREIVLLRYAAGLDSTQIGETLGLSPGAVRMRLSRARQRLAERLGAD